MAFPILFAGLLAAAPFPQAGSDLAPDPAARYGGLPNGVRYVVVRHERGDHHVALRLVVDAGSREERNGEEGLAHFLEHMAFNGSAHYPPSTLVKRLQRMGMSFGPDANADTDFNRTLYLLDLPDDSAAELREGLQIFADYAGGLTFPPELIDKERGVILSEKLARDTARRRIGEARRRLSLQGTLLPRRQPIGVPDVVRHLNRPQFVDYYDAWYRPERLTVVAVGALDPVLVAAEIARAFSPLRPRAPARPDPGLGRLDPAPGLHVSYYPLLEEPGPAISVTTIVPLSRAPDSAGGRRERALRELAVAIIDARLARLARPPDAPFVSGRVLVHDRFRFFRETRLELGCKRGEWKRGVEAAEHELRRIVEFGFQPAEVREAAAIVRRKLADAARNSAGRPAKTVADDLVHSLLDGEVFLSPEQEQALLEPVIDRATPEACAGAFRALWSAPHRFLLVAGGVGIEGDAAGQIAAAYTAASSVPLGPLPPLVEKAWTYTDFGPAGRVARRTVLPELGVTLATFANGVRVNLKPTRFESDRIEVNVRLGTGELDEPNGQAGLGYFTSQVFVAGGLGRYDADDLRHIFAGQAVGTEFIVADDAFILRGSTDRENLAAELQLVAAQISDPGFRPESEESARTLVASHYYTLIRSLHGPLSAIVPRLLANGDVRIGLPPAEPVFQRTLAEAKTWLGPQLRSGAIEVTLAGDFDPDAALAALAGTLGALPPREPKPALRRRHRLSFPSHPFDRSYIIPSEIPTAMVSVYWPTTDGIRLHTADVLHVLARALEDRLREKVREELGETYTPFAVSLSSTTYPRYGYIQAEVTLEPAKAARLVQVIADLGESLARGGISADELERARQPLLARLREEATTNRYWVGVLAEAQERPASLERPRRELADFESITREDVDDLAREYLPRGRAFLVTVKPALKAYAPGAE